MLIESAAAKPLAPCWFTNKKESTKKEKVAISLLTAWYCNKSLNSNNWRIQKVAKYVKYPPSKIINGKKASINSLPDRNCIKFLPNDK